MTWTRHSEMLVGAGACADFSVLPDDDGNEATWYVTYSFDGYEYVSAERYSTAEGAMTEAEAIDKRLSYVLDA